MKSVVDLVKEEERKEFLTLSPMERMETMHNILMQIMTFLSNAEGVSEYEIYTRYLKNNSGYYQRSPC